MTTTFSRVKIPRLIKCPAALRLGFFTFIESFILFPRKKEGMTIQFSCPTCLKELDEGLKCASCKVSYSFKEGMYKFVEEKDTHTWDTYWKRIPVYDTVLDFLRKIMNLQLRRYLKKFLPVSGVALEPGGGSAYVSALLAEQGFSSYALDYASAPLMLAQKQLQSRAVLVQGDMFHMPFSEGVFDLTFNNSTLEHLSNPLDALNEMKRVTRKGGYVFVGVPFTYGPLCVYKLKKSSFKGAWDGTTYDRRGLKKLFSDAGLEIVGSRTFFFSCFVGVMGRKVD